MSSVLLQRRPPSLRVLDSNCDRFTQLHISAKQNDNTCISTMRDATIITDNLPLIFTSLYETFFLLLHFASLIVN